MRMTLRTRLLLTSLLTLAVGLGALLVLGNVLLARRVQAEASSVLRANAETQLAALDVGPAGVRVRETAEDPTLDRRSWVLSRGRVVERPADVPADVDRAAVALGRGGMTAESALPGRELRLRAQPVRTAGAAPRTVGAVVVLFSTASLERLQDEVLLGSLVVAALVLLAGGLAIRSAVDGALRPVARMTSEAEDWGAHDLERRFGLGPPRDELTALAATLDHLLARIAASRRHEQRFAGEVAHELRTPLTTLRLQAEVAARADGPDADAERRDALGAIVGQVSRLDGAIDTLLAVARAEIDPSRGTVDLEALARGLEDVEVRTQGDVPLAEGDGEVVRRALAPLLENARRHTRGRVWVELDTDGTHVRLAVRDDGPGVDPTLGERVFEPGVRGADEPEGGAGLGLPLARRMARSCGGDVRLGPGPGGCVVLELPALGTGG